MKSIGKNLWFLKQQSENKLKAWKKFSLYRRYWDAGTQKYIWETTPATYINDDIQKCGNIVWKADTDQLNVWKTGNLSFEVDNKDGRWNPTNTKGYFQNGTYIPYLSIIRVEIGFEAEDGTVYEIFVYQGLIPLDGIQIDNVSGIAQIKLLNLDYLLEQLNAEDISQKPIDPAIIISNADIFGATTIGKTGSGWGVNSYQFRNVRIISGTGIGQERKILSNTATTLTVNAWVINPDATSDFEISGECIGTGDGATDQFFTIQSGVGKILKVWIDDVLKYEGTDYEVGQLNEASLQANVTFRTAPLLNEKIICDYLYWYQDETFKYLIEKILIKAELTDYDVSDVTFEDDLGNGVEVNIDYTSQVDWLSGTAYQLNLTRVSGDCYLETNSVGVLPYVNVIKPWSSGVGDVFKFNDRVTSDFQGAKIKQTFYAYDNLKINAIYLYLMRTLPGHGILTLQVFNNSDVLLGTATYDGWNVRRQTYVRYNYFDAVKFDFASSNIYFTKDNYYYFVLYVGSPMLEDDSLKTVIRIDGQYNEGKLKIWRNDCGRWYPTQVGEMQYLRGYDLAFELDIEPHQTFGTWMSPTTDCGASLQSYGKLTAVYEMLSGSNNAIKIYTKSADTDSFPVTFVESEWDEIGLFGKILSTPKRYLRIAFKMERGYGATGSSPIIHSINAKYYTATFKPSLANFTGMNGKSAIELIASLSNYEMGFYTKFDDSVNMTWDEVYDASSGNLPVVTGWTEQKSDSGTQVIDSGKLKISNGNLQDISIYGTAIHNGELYAVSYLWTTGYNGIGKVLKYNSVGDYWDVLYTQLDVDGGGFSNCVDLNGILYILGNDTILYEFNDVTNTITAVSNRAHLIDYFYSTLVIINDEIYTASNQYAILPYLRPSLYKWNGTNDWILLASIPGAASPYYINDVIEFNGEIYCIDPSYLLKYDGTGTLVNVGFYGESSNNSRSACEHNSKLYISQTSFGAGINDKTLLETVVGGGGLCTFLVMSPKIGDLNSIDKIIEFNGKIYGVGSSNFVDEGGNLFEWNEIDLFVEVAPQPFLLWKDLGSVIIYKDSLCSVFAWCTGDYHGELYQWNNVDAWQILVSGFQYYAYNEKTITGFIHTSTPAGSGYPLSKRYPAWTIEMEINRSIDSSSQEDSLENGYGVTIEDGTFKTTVMIGATGRVQLKDLFENTANINKSGMNTVGDYYVIRVARLGTMVKVQINNEVVLCSYSDKRSSNTGISFGQLDYGYASDVTLLKTFKYNLGVACFDTFYLPQYVFKPKVQYKENDIELKVDDNYISLYDYTDGYNNVWNFIRATFGEYFYTSNPETEMDDHPNSIDKYGKKYLEISGEEFLNTEDTNLAVGVSKRYYLNYKLPKRRFTLLSKYLFQIDVADRIKVSSLQPSFIPGLDSGKWDDGGLWNDGDIWDDGTGYYGWFIPGIYTKIIGITINLMNYTIELECEEIL